MLSTKSHKNSTYVFVSQLALLLRERRKTQRELAVASGIAEETISRLMHQPVPKHIACHTAIQICLGLSRWRRHRDKRKVPIRLDALYTLKRLAQ